MRKYATVAMICIVILFWNIKSSCSQTNQTVQYIAPLSVTPEEKKILQEMVENAKVKKITEQLSVNEEFKKTMLKNDLDKDGALSLAEYMKSAPICRSNRNECEVYFKEMDKDNNGKLSLEELAYRSTISAIDSEKRGKMIEPKAFQLLKNELVE